MFFLPCCEGHHVSSFISSLKERKDSSSLCLKARLLPSVAIQDGAERLVTDPNPSQTHQLLLKGRQVTARPTVDLAWDQEFKDYKVIKMKR